MKRRIFLTIFIIAFTYSNSILASNLRLLVRIEKNERSFQIKTLESSQPMPGVGIDESIRKKISNLRNGDEAILVGEIQYPGHNLEGSDRYIPFFIITEIHPISLKELGINSELTVQSNLDLKSKIIDYTPSTIPVSTEVASAITLTTSLLLMNELSSARPSYEFNRDMTNALFLSTGFMATLFLIYEQIEGKK